MTIENNKKTCNDINTKMVSPTAPDAAEADRTKEDRSKADNPKADSLKTADRVIETNEERETYELGVRMGREARAGQVYTLIGDLGVGKTVFTKGLAAGLGIIEPVSSPTFTIVQIYEEGRLPFYHFDVYRIGDVEEMDEIGYEDYIYGGGVSLIEWADLIREILPGHYTEIRIEKDLEQGFDYRRISICEY